MIKSVSFHRFKRFKDKTVELRPGLSLLAGGNNAGKSTLLHGLAVWEFCRTAIEMERGADAFLAGAGRQGLGLGDEEFSPINVPSLKHLWTNLKSQKVDEPDGYTLKIRCVWDLADAADRELEFGLSLSNDRLFVKTTDSNLATGEKIPRVAYLPPFAGMTDRETRLTGAIRRRRIGEGLAGAVLRNLLLDMNEANLAERRRLRGDRTKISDADLKRLRATDPWELLQDTLRRVFGAELDIIPFREEYHSYIRVEIVRGDVDGYKLKRWKDFSKRDLMVEGSGFLQWLSVYALATDSNIDTLLLDEPDAHLHPALQTELVDSLKRLASATGKQVLSATHSAEILRRTPPEEILEVRSQSGNASARYLFEEQQKVGLLAGLGSDYAPRIDRAKQLKRIFFYEGTSDAAVLQALADVEGLPWPNNVVMWQTSAPHKERKQVFLALQEEVSELRAVSLVDRDDMPASTVDAALRDQGVQAPPGFTCLKWRRRHIESYLIWPPAIAAATGLSEEDITARLRDQHALAIGDSFPDLEPPAALLDARGKQILREGTTAILGQFDAGPVDVARHMPADKIPADIGLLFTALADLSAGTP